MMSLEKFTRVIELIESQRKLEKDFSKAIDLVNTSWSIFELAPHSDAALNLLLEEVFTKEGAEHISWWIYEKKDFAGDCFWDADGTVIPTETIEDVYNYLITLK